MKQKAINMLRSLAGKASAPIGVLCLLAASTQLTTSLPAFAEENLTAKEYCDRAMKEGEAGQYSAAIFDYTKSLHVDPEYWKSYGNRSAAKYNSGDYAGAKADVDVCIAHMGPLKPLLNLQKLCIEKLTPSPEQAARIRAAQQMLLNAQLGIGNDISSPASMIMMQAARIRAARDAQALLQSKSNAGSPAAASAPPAPSHIDDPSTRLSERLQSIAQSTPSAPPKSAAKAPEKTTVKTALKASEKPGAKASAHVSENPQDSASEKLAEKLAANTQESPADNSFEKTAIASATTTQAAPAKPELTSQQYFDRACGKGHAMDLVGAIQDYDEAIKLNPNYGEAYANRGSARFNTGDHKGALEDFNKALTIMPNNQQLKALRDQVSKMQ